MPSLLAHAQFVSTGGSGAGGTLSFTIPAGTKIVIAHGAFYAGTNALILTSALNGAMTRLTGATQTPSLVESEFFYTANPTTGADTITISGASTYSVVDVWAFDGIVTVSPLDGEAAATGSAFSTTLTPHSITPTNDGSLVVVGIATDGAGSSFTNSSLTIPDQSNYVAGNSEGGAAGYVVLGAGTAGIAYTPNAWGWTGGASPASNIAVFVPSPGTSINLTGASATGSAGTFGIGLSQNPTLTGASATASAGTFGLAIGPAINVTGAQATASAGTFGFAISSNITLVGAQATASAGGFNNLTATDQTDGTIFQRIAGGTTKAVPFSGTYSGTLPASIEIKLVNIVGGATAQDWTPLTSATISGGTWSGNLSTPQGGGYHFFARSKDSLDAVVVTTPLASSNYWAVGRNTLCIGQSNMWEMAHFSDTPPTPNTNVRMFYDAQGVNAGSWQATAGNGTIRHANVLNDGFGIPVGIVMLAVGGTTLADWLDLTAGSVYELAITHLANAGTDVEEIIWAQGEFDIIVPTPHTSTATYLAGMGTIYSRLLAVIGRSAANCHFGTYCLGNIQYTDATDESTNAIRLAHLEWSGSRTGAFFAGSAVDMVRIPGSPPDAFHWQTPYYERMARRYAQASLYQAGLASYGADGLTLAAAHGKIGSAVITLQLTQNGGTGLRTADGGTSGVGLTAFEVSDDGFATTKTISSTAFSQPSNILLTLSAAPANPFACAVRYQYGENPDITTVAYDNTTPGGDTLGLPLQPTQGSVNVTPDLAARNSLMNSVGRMMNRGA